jgi:sulfite exporter TauE/SafE
MWRFLFIGFLIAHGLVHLAIWLMPKPPDDKAPFVASHSWLIGDRKVIAASLAVVAAALLVLAGMGLWAHADWWRVVAVLGLGISFGLMVVYFNPRYLPIQGVNLALIVGIIWLTWPSKAMVGA